MPMHHPLPLPYLILILLLSSHGFTLLLPLPYLLPQLLLLFLLQGGVVLDLGCGSASSSIAMAK